jgi:hypothetical protein
MIKRNELKAGDREKQVSSLFITPAQLKKNG